MIKTSKKMKMLIFLLLIFGVIFGMLKAPKVLAENLNPPPSYGADNGSRFYAYDKGRLLKPVFQTDPSQETDYWAFCLDWNRDVPNYNPETGKHDGEFTLIVNPTIEQFGNAMPTQHGGSTALQREPTAQVYERVKRLMYIYAKDPTNIQARFGINSQTFWNIVSNAIYYYTNSIPVTTYTGSNSGLNAPKDAVYAALDDPNLIPAGTELEFRLYQADWRVGRGIQSLSSLRIVEKKEIQFSKRNVGGEEIAGATIKIRKGNQDVASWVSQENQTHTLQLDPGSYTFHEESAPTGYQRVLDINFEVTRDGQVNVITDPSSSTKTEGKKLIVTDKSVDFDIEISKRNADGQEIAGAKLQILKDGKEVTSWTSEATRAHKLKLAQGRYIFREVLAPKTYREVQDIEFEVTDKGQLIIHSDRDNAGKLENNNKMIVTDQKAPVKKVRFLVDKQNTDGDKLVGRFYLYHVSKSGLVEINKTNTNTNNPAPLQSGDIELKPIDGNDYDEFVIRETVAPDGYQRFPEDIRVRVYLADGRVTVANALDLVKHVDPVYRQPLIGVGFKDTDQGRELTLTVKNIKQTEMKVKKVDVDNASKTLAGAKFALADSEENARAGKFLKKVVRQEEYLGKRTYIVNEDDPIYTGAPANDKSDYIVTSGEDGISTFEHLDPRKTYYAVEVEAPNGYIKETTPIALTKDNATNARAVVKTNAKPKYQFKVRKTDEDGNSLSARFYFYRQSNMVTPVDRALTNTNEDNTAALHRGDIELVLRDNHDYEDFVYRETVAPDGYFRPLKDIQLRVHTNGNAEILNPDDFIGTDGNSLVSVEVREVSGNRHIVVTVKNVMETVMKIKKLDATDRSHLLPGAKFALADSPENAKFGKFLKRITRDEEYSGKRTYLVNETDPLYIGLDTRHKAEAEYTVTTGEDGIATFEHLDPRKTYYAVEVAAPEGFILDKTPVTLTKDNSTDQTAAIMTNSKPRFRFNVAKTDEAGNNLAARFYFYRKSDLTNRIDRTNTDNNNPTRLHRDLIDLIPAAGQDYEDFVLRETVAPDGYLRVTDDIVIRVYSSGKAEILNRDKFIGSQGQPLFNNITVENGKWWLNPQDQVDENEDLHYEFTISVQNVAETSMRIKKVDGADEKTVLAGAQFAIADSLENAKAGKFLKLVTEQVEWNTSTHKAQYSWESAGSQADATIVTTGQDGLASFDHLDPRKEYYAVEVKAPDGYALDKTPHKLTKETKDTPLTVQNIKRGIFPSTGGVGMIAFVVAGLTLMGFAAFSKNRYKPKH